MSKPSALKKPKNPPPRPPVPAQPANGMPPLALIKNDLKVLFQGSRESVIQMRKQGFELSASATEQQCKASHDRLVQALDHYEALVEEKNQREAQQNDQTQAQAPA